MTPVSDNEGRGPRRWKPLATAGATVVGALAAAGLALVVTFALALAAIGNGLSHVGE